MPPSKKTNNNREAIIKTTGIFTIYKYKIHFRRYHEPIHIVPFGDIHRSAPGCDVERWHKFLKWAKDAKDCFFLGMGDYDDLASASERRILNDPDFHDSTRQSLEDVYQKYIRQFAQEISFMKGRLIGLIEGNHYTAFSDGTTSTQRLCQLMGCRYLGASAFVRLILKSQSSTSHKVDIWAHHGLGAARLVGGSINRVQQMVEAAEADIFLMGHDHKKSAAMISRLYLHDNQSGRMILGHRRILFARTGSFLKGYEPDRASYIVDKAMNPTDLGVVRIDLVPEQSFEDGRSVRKIDIHASI